MSEPEAELRFYEELNDFLPRHRRKRSFFHRFNGTPTVKDVVESLGVPHTAIDVILVDGESVGFDRRLEGGERVAVYPVFERFDVKGLTRLRPEPLRYPKFIADVHLGKLARYLRLLGLDTVYERDLEDAEIADGAGELGFYAPHSWWPILVALAASVAATGVALWLPWLIVAGAVCVLSAVAGLVFEYYTGPERH